MSDANRFMNATYALYNAVERSHINSRTFYLKNKNKLFAKEEKVNVNMELMAAVNGASNLYANTIINSCFDNFRMLYEFAEYIKLMEKIFFYKNDIKACVVCDSKLTDNKKTIIIRNDDIMIAISLARVDEHRKTVVMIKRNYGEGMENLYHMEDGEYKDVNTKSDKILLSLCSDIVSKTIASFFATVINSIGNECFGDIAKQELFKTYIGTPPTTISIKQIDEIKGGHYVALSSLLNRTPEEIDNLSKNKIIIYY